MCKKAQKYCMAGMCVYDLLTLRACFVRFFYKYIPFGRKVDEAWKGEKKQREMMLFG